MADENLQVNPAVENLNEQPQPENENPAEGNEEETTEKEEEESTEEDNTPGGAADVIYAEIRNQIVEKHGEEVLQGISTKLENLEDLSDADLNLIAEASGYKKDDVAAHVNLRYENVRLAEKAAKIDQQEADAYIAEINEIAGGSYEELIDFVSKEASPAKISIWNAAIATNNKDTQKEVLKEMADFRQSKQPQPKQANKPADLGLLTKANASATKTTQQQASHPLDGNPLAYLASESAGINKLCAIKLDANNPNRDNAIEVLKVVAPDLL